MRRLLRFILLSIFYIILPCLVFNQAVHHYVDDQNAAHKRATLQSMEEELTEFRRRIVHERDRALVTREVMDRFTIPGSFTEEGAEKIRREFSEKYPELLTILPFSFKNKKLNAFLPKSLKFHFLFKALAIDLLSLTDGRSDISDKVSAMSESKEKMVTQKLFDKSIKLDVLRFRRGYHSQLTMQKKAATFFWDLAGIKKNREGLILILVHDDAFQKIFSLQETANRLQQRFSTKGWNLHITENHTKAVSLLQKLALTTETPSSLASQLIIDNQKTLAIVSSTGIDNPYALAISMDQQKIHQKSINYSFLINSTTIFLIILAMSVVLSIESNYWSPFISVRFKFIALFLLSTMIPLSVIWFFGERYLTIGRIELEQKQFSIIQQRIKRIDSEFTAAMDKIRQRAINIRNNQLTSSSALLLDWIDDYCKRNETSEISQKKLNSMFYIMLQPGHENDFKTPLFAAVQSKKEEIFSSASYYADQLIKESYVKDMHVLVTGGESGKSRFLFSRPHVKLPTLNRQMVMSLSEALIRHAKTGSFAVQYQGLERKREQKLDLLDEIPAFDAILRNRNRINHVDVFNFRIDIMVDPFYDQNGKILGAIGMSFNLEQLRRDIIAQFAHEERSVEIQLLAGHTKNMAEKYPNLQSFTHNSQLDSLFDQVVKSHLPVQTVLHMNQQKNLVVATPLQNFPNHIFIGYYPYQKIEKICRENRNLFILLIAVTILVAVLIGFFLAQQFIAPVKEMQRGVKALSAGKLDERVTVENLDELGVLGNAFNEMAQGLQEKERMSRYVSETVLEEVKKDPVADSIGEERKVTVLFADIRSFTTLSENHSADEMVRMLNDYLDYMTDAIREAGGVVDKFIGDAVMAVFRPDWPDDSETDEIKAVKAALAMRKALSEFNEKRKRDHLFTVENGIGLATGIVIQGSIGSHKHRVDLTVIGDTVNLSARLEAMSKDGNHTKIILSEETLKPLIDLVEVEALGAKLVKGKNQSVQVYELIAWKNSEQTNTNWDS